MSLPKQEIDKIKNIVISKKHIHGIQNIYSRTVGKNIFLEFDLIIDDDLSISQAHDIVLKIQKEIQNIYPYIQTRIQFEPFPQSKNKV